MIKYNLYNDNNYNTWKLFGGRIYNLDSFMDVSLMLVFLLCWDDENINHLTPNGHYMGRTAQLTSRRYILYIYSTNIRTEYFKHAA